MDDSVDPLPIDVLTQRLRDGTHEGVCKSLEAYHQLEIERRKELLRAVRSVADERVVIPGPAISVLGSFLTDENRSVRLTAARLFVAIAKANPDTVVAVSDALADRLADDDEFYYVRARVAEALGYIAIDYPDEVITPELLADLRIGLSLDEPEVREKLAKALAYVALGNQDRLRHQVPRLADHLDVEDELVRYHLCTAIVVVGCEHPDALADVVDALLARLDDENPYVGGRAAEALGLVARSDAEVSARPEQRLKSMADNEEVFTAERARFALAGLEAEPTNAAIDSGVGSLETIRDRTDEIVDEITAPDGDECHHCGLTVPDGGPPMCPRCGVPQR